MFRRGMIGAIRFYQRVLSPLTGPSCRFTPTCSEFAAGAIGRHGALSGGWLACKRILRCRPFGGQGYDPVPEVTGGRAMVGDVTGGEAMVGNVVGSQAMVGDARLSTTVSRDLHSSEDMR